LSEDELVLVVKPALCRVVLRTDCRRLLTLLIGAKLMIL
jgi:hypothetical protein